MKIAIAGAGAMGSRFGFMLHSAGNDVVLLDMWQEHVRAIQNKGLEVVHDSGQETITIEASHPRDYYGKPDVFILFTKAMQTEDMLCKCQHLLGADVKVLTLQNGLGNIDVIEQRMPKENIFAGVTTFAAKLLKPGQVEALGSGDTEIMQIYGNDTEALLHLIDTFNHANIHAALSQDVMKSIWQKAAFNSVLNPLCTLMQNTVAAIGGYSRIDQLIEPLVEEIITVAKAEEVILEKENMLRMIRGVFDPSMSGHHMSSMYHDVKNGRKTEVDFLNGAIVEKAQRYHIDVPYNHMLYHLISMLEETAPSYA
ncbi:ketopantoate reductase [Alteribacillus persepolensis]|uniref:2-dehydropantoate 2-reductase n=1 Tax=Alteribacillus persepolensis TaxID=568899 RepID=A0A1G8A685_9BACI|nr:2-dehydropantoate 2-reductase [Alteribacillus persepolensis]SDH16438.1 ketopantoate reductase [Alteribacillus persepolensis]